ncbi:DUF4083 domain-containing protein [Pradoshia sp.]
MIMNTGDILFQLFAIIFMVIIAAVIISIFRSRKQRREQFDRMEKKIDGLSKELKRK